MKNRVGQRVLICFQPRMVAEVTGGDEERQLWQGKMIEPTGMNTPLEWREEFLAVLDARGEKVERDAEPD